MITDHHLKLIEPKSNDKIWRYLDFTKYVDLLYSKKLFFSELRFFEKFEGSLPTPTVEARNKILKARNPDWKPQGREAFTKHIRDSVVINCWHRNNYESAAMWELYNNSKEGVAIQSTYGLLKTCLNDSQGMFRYGPVQYIDFQTHELPYDNNYAPIFAKRTSYAHEQEIRAVIMLGQGVENSEVTIVDGGLKVEINLSNLIENVYVHPEAQTWFFNLVTTFTEQYGFPVKKSDLENDPVF